jgi:LysR family transcriptional regulator of gallate degradation
MNEFRPPDANALDGLHHIRVFLTVARTGSIARSADQIFKAPSAITRSINELEQTLGTRLFERQPRGMLLNSYGEAVQSRALRIHEEIRLAIDEFCHSKSEGNALAGVLFSGRKLQLFIAVAEMRNISRVARHLGLSQAGVSMALARMESTLGQPLFHRMLQGMVITDAATRLLARSKRINAELRHMQSDLSAIAGTLVGRVAIGALPLGRTQIVPQGIAAALKLHPGLRVTTVESPYEVLASGLRNGDIDFIFGALRNDEHGRGLIAEPLFSDRLGIIARAKHPLTGRERISLEELLSQQWILPRIDAPGRRLIDESFQELGLEPPFPSVETGDLAILRSLLLNSDMLTPISPHQLCFELKAGDLVELPVQLGKTMREIGITLREGAQLSPATEVVLASIRAQAWELNSAR